MSFSPGVCFAAPPPSPSIPHVCGWISHAAAWLGCKPLIDSSQLDWTVSSPGDLTAHPQAPYPHRPGGSLNRDGNWARDPQGGLCPPKTLPPCGWAGSAQPLETWCHPLAVWAPCPAAMSLLLAALGPFPSLHRNESSLLSSPAGAAVGLAGLAPASAKGGSLTWQHARCELQPSGHDVQAPGRILISPAHPLTGHPAWARGRRRGRQRMQASLQAAAGLCHIHLMSGVGDPDREKRAWLALPGDMER